MLKAEPHFSTRLTAVSESKTTRIFTLAQELRRKGREIISLAVGEPDFDTPGPIIAATQKALADQHTRYGPVPGEPELRERLARGFDGYGADNILVTNGAKQALYSLFQVLCDPGDEVILAKPCWVSFTEQIVLAGVAASHRSEAFFAAEFIMDYLKTEAPFWKRECHPEGESWVDAKATDQRARDRW